MKKIIVVNANKSWYEAYIPFYIYFAHRACNDAHILVNFMGNIEPETRLVMESFGLIGDFYTIVENYKPNYGQSPIAAKMSRWVVSDKLISDYDLMYIGDIDMLLANEGANDLFSQHLKHTEKLGIPVSNKVRKNQKRLTGLHFFVCKPYFTEMSDEIKNLDMMLSKLGRDENKIKKIYPKGVEDEELLYDMINLVRPDWVERLKTTSFRPYHGAHLGNFRHKQSKAYLYLKNCIETNTLSENQRLYLSDVYFDIKKNDLINSAKLIFDKFPEAKQVFDNFYEFMSENIDKPAFAFKNN